jgi:hypothetical protein
MTFGLRPARNSRFNVVQLIRPVAGVDLGMATSSSNRRARRDLGDQKRPRIGDTVLEREEV